MKLKKNRNVVALLTSFSLLSLSTVTYASNKNIDAYYDNDSINIQNYNSFTLEISKSKLEQLLKQSNEEIILVKVGNEELRISKDELVRLKNKALEYDRENREYTMFICLIGGVVSTAIIVKESIKQKIYK